MQYRLGELFCGPGGIAWGATHADIGNSDYSIVHQWANDYDANSLLPKHHFDPYCRLLQTEILSVAMSHAQMN